MAAKRVANKKVQYDGLAERSFVITNFLSTTAMSPVFTDRLESALSNLCTYSFQRRSRQK